MGLNYAFICPPRDSCNKEQSQALGGKAKLNSFVWAKKKGQASKKRPFFPLVVVQQKIERAWRGGKRAAAAATTEKQSSKIVNLFVVSPFALGPRAAT